MPWMSTDVVRRAIFEAAPETGIDPDHSFPQKQASFEPYLKSMFRSMSGHWPRSLIEGDVLLPNHVVETEPDTGIRAVFLGLNQPNLSLVIEHGGATQWLDRFSPEEQVGVMINIRNFSDLVRNECDRLDLPYFDMSNDFELQQQRAFKILTEER